MGGIDPEHATNAKGRQLAAAYRAPDRLLAHPEQPGSLGHGDVTHVPVDAGPRIDPGAPARRMSVPVEEVELRGVLSHARAEGAVPYIDEVLSAATRPLFGGPVSRSETSAGGGLARHARGEDIRPVGAPGAHAELSDRQGEHLLEGARHARGQMDAGKQ